MSWTDFDRLDVTVTAGGRTYTATLLKGNGELVVVSQPEPGLGQVFTLTAVGVCPPLGGDADQRVAEMRCTGLACPEQWEGTLIDGRPFYLRFRFGWAGLGIGEDRYATRDAAVLVDRDGINVRGSFDSPEEMGAVLRVLLDEALDPANQPYRCEGCGKTSRIVAHRPGCSVAASFDAVASSS